ncbi:MAG: phosphoglucosamine mutase, partial [Helicobacter sp.]|nr:phosphoglucosamine mutase [Helicobacter sp.]
LEGYGNLLKEINSKKIRHLIRYSGTENKLRILLEGKDLKLLENTMQECEEYFRGKID